MAQATVDFTAIFGTKEVRLSKGEEFSGDKAIEHKLRAMHLLEDKPVVKKEK